jgi:hypothetical protein
MKRKNDKRRKWYGDILKMLEKSMRQDRPEELKNLQGRLNQLGKCIAEMMLSQFHKNTQHYTFQKAWKVQQCYKTKKVDIAWDSRWRQSKMTQQGIFQTVQ